MASVFNKTKQSDYASTIKSYQDAILKDPSRKESYSQRIDLYQVADSWQNSYKKANLEGQIGIGIDVGGLTLDLTYAQNLTPAVDGVTVQNQTYAFKQNYGYWALGLGYKLFPLKQHLLTPRKNKAYERIKQDIPFYRNEFYVATGLLAEDIGSEVSYENRYTRYLSRRVGITAGLSYSHNFLSSNERYGRKGSINQLALLTGVRFLLLYSRRHTIGVTTGPMLTYADELKGSFNQQTVSGQTVSYLNLTQRSAVNELRVGWHSNVDYNLALTDRLIAGPWLRVFSQSSIVPNAGAFGIQAGYRF